MRKKVEEITQKLKKSEAHASVLSAENVSLKSRMDELNQQLAEMKDLKASTDEQVSELKKEHEEQNNQLLKVRQEKETLIAQLLQVQKNVPPEMVLNNDDERTAYAAGQNYAVAVGRNLQRQKEVGVLLSRPELIAGLTDGLNHKNKLPAEEITSLTERLDNKLNDRLQKKQQVWQEVSEKQAREGLAFYEKFARTRGVQKATEGKALYQILSAGKGTRVREEDTITILLSGSLPDGTIFDDSGLKKRAQKIKADSVLPALTRGLTLIGKGGRIKIVLPPEEAFGFEGVPPTIPGNATLIFDVQMLDVKSGV